MIEFPLKWVILLAGAFLALAVGFGVILVYLLIQRSNSNAPEDKTNPSRAGVNLLERIDERLFSRKSTEPVVVVAPPVQGEDNQNWVLLYRQPETEHLTLSLPGKEIVIKPEELTPVQLMQVKSMALGLQHWLGLTLNKPAEKPAAKAAAVPVSPAPPLPQMIDTPPSEPVKSHPLTRSIFTRRDVEEIKPMVSIAVQINAYLQNILLQENYAGPDLYLTDNAEGDLVVVSGVEKYIGVDAVPDPKIAELIKRAAEQWTNHHLRHG
ncbi:MAG: hypothetical protein V2J07_04970 [Anaerolineae bacterium]|jgi:hypothetical protein|nr:hypothetical protein [Anaerolineae bacterium]